MPIRVVDLRSDNEIITLTDARYLKLDQTTPQTVVSGSPQFNEGLTIKENKRIYLDGI